MSEFDKKLGEFIRMKRQEARLPQQRLAIMVGVSKNQIGKYERGENRLTVVRFVRISRALGLGPSVFFSDALSYIRGDH